jgi:preprotein translocase subunit SecF
MRAVFLFLIPAAALVAFLVYAFAGAGSFEFGLHGWIALALGSVLSIALAVGLVALMVHSAERGYDDRVRDLPNDEPD